MKLYFTVRYIKAPQVFTLTRELAAHYLRAARSRRRGNILRTAPHRYRVLDCGLVVEGGAHLPAVAGYGEDPAIGDSMSAI